MDKQLSNGRRSAKGPPHFTNSQSSTEENFTKKKPLSMATRSSDALGRHKAVIFYSRVLYPIGLPISLIINESLQDFRCLLFSSFVTLTVGQCISSSESMSPSSSSEISSSMSSSTWVDENRKSLSLKDIFWISGIRPSSFITGGQTYSSLTLLTLRRRRSSSSVRPWELSCSASMV